jgi:hypothetical protein
MTSSSTSAPASRSSYLDCNCFAIRQAARYVSQLYERHLSGVGLTGAQFTLVAAISPRRW